MLFFQIFAAGRANRFEPSPVAIQAAASAVGELIQNPGTRLTV